MILSDTAIFHFLPNSYHISLYLRITKLFQDIFVFTIIVLWVAHNRKCGGDSMLVIIKIHAKIGVQMQQYYVIIHTRDCLWIETPLTRRLMTCLGTILISNTGIYVLYRYAVLYERINIPSIYINNPSLNDWTANIVLSINKNIG